MNAEFIVPNILQQNQRLPQYIRYFSFVIAWISPWKDIFLLYSNENSVLGYKNEAGV